MTAAAVARAAVEVNRHRQLNSPAGLSLECLSSATTGQKSSISNLPRRRAALRDAPTPEVAEVACNSIVEMGCRTRPAPTATSAPAILPPEPSSAPFPALADNQPQPEQEALPVLVSCLDGSTAVVEIYVDDTVLVLR